MAALSKGEGEPLEDYYARVRDNDLALQVKLADIHDNLDPRRRTWLAAPDADELALKYGKALTALFGE